MSRKMTMSLLDVDFDDFLNDDRAGNVHARGQDYRDLSTVRAEQRAHQRALQGPHPEAGDDREAGEDPARHTALSGQRLDEAPDVGALTKRLHDGVEHLRGV